MPVMFAWDRQAILAFVKAMNASEAEERQRRSALPGEVRLKLRQAGDEVLGHAYVHHMGLNLPGPEWKVHQPFSVVQASTTIKGELWVPVAPL